MKARRGYAGPETPLWYKDAVIYEVHLRAFHDSNADGIGDFPGLTEKLDYLKDLGINTLWLLPFYPSPLKDDGYDIADYENIHPMYGTMADFQLFLKEAHQRDLKIITELVINHTSDQHGWFQRARRAPAGHPHRDFYVWSDSPEKYKDARIIFKDFEASNWTWDPVAKAYYWHRFYSHQPDLNFDNPEVHKAVKQALDFWFDKGVDGLRLDAIPYLFEREGTSCENLPETHAYLKTVRAHLDARHKNRLLLAEANQWPEDATAYFGDGNECHMAFHFPIMPRMFMAVHMEDRYPLIDILDQTPPIPANCQWGLFLRNHDELTLEMVTDEERDYMYRVYAHDPRARINLGIRRRLAPLLANNRRKMELLNGLLFSLPGTPVIYYGDEIGMGDNIYLGDRDGVRTPMQWSSDKNAGFSRANPQKLYLPVTIDPEYHYEAINVESQQGNPHSMLWWMKRLISLSRKHKAFGRGTMEILHPENRKVFAFIRQHEDETLLAVFNLSRFVQFVELDLGRFKGRRPVELFGRTEFPAVGEDPYLLTLGPHAFYWFRLDTAPVPSSAAPAAPAAIEVEARWTAVFESRARAALEEAFARWMPARRWFAGKDRVIKAMRILHVVPFGADGDDAVFAGVQAEFIDGTRQTYSIPLSFASGERALTTLHAAPGAVIASLRVRGTSGERSGVIYDAVHDPAFAADLLEALGRRRQFRGRGDRVQMTPTPGFRRLRGPDSQPLAAQPVKTEQSNSSIVYGDRLILKLMRRLEPGLNPDLEIGRFLMERADFKASPPVGGYLEYAKPNEPPMILGILSGFVPNQGDAWTYTRDALDRYYEAVVSRAQPLSSAPARPLLDLVDSAPPADFLEIAGAYLEVARSLGLRTADLHLALASAPDDKDFSPEPYTPFYQRSVYQSMRNQVGQVFPLLRKRLDSLSPPAREEARRILDLQPAILERFQAIARTKISTCRIRIHGDFHLGQVLHTGKDFVILDFEGEPARPLSERRLKRSPVRDVAGLLRSLQYAAYSALEAVEREEEIPADRLAGLEAGARLWIAWASSAYLRAYLERAGKAAFLPATRETLSILLDAFLLDRCVSEIGYELAHRPDWIRIPMRGLLRHLEPAGHA
ncbi:MAG TPA: maltose alpha-D-glucosyltransferase [Planctomycetota bacterium]